MLSVFTLGFVTNWLAAALLAFTIFFYVVIYTMWLKRSTPHEHRHRRRRRRAAADGRLSPPRPATISLASVVLFAIIFIWTPPHFWALALLKSEDYGRAGVPMLPNVAGRRTARGSKS